jgi:hypothetical protein
LSRTWTEDLGLNVLLATFAHGDVAPAGAQRQVRLYRSGGIDVMEAGLSGPGAVADLLEFGRKRYDIVVVDLTGARETVAIEVLRASTSILFVCDSLSATLNAVADQSMRLRALNLEERCGLLLDCVPGGLRPDLAEELAGLPVCGLTGSRQQVHDLARWLASAEALRLANVL